MNPSHLTDELLGMLEAWARGEKQYFGWPFNHPGVLSLVAEVRRLRTLAEDERRMKDHVMTAVLDGLNDLLPVTPAAIEHPGQWDWTPEHIRARALALPEVQRLREHVRILEWEIEVQNELLVVGTDEWTSMKQEAQRMRQALDRIAAAVGMPDAAEACRVVLALVKEARG